MQQLLQGMQIQGKALNQVSTDINTRMDNMFTELNTKYDTVSNHIKRIDVQLAQTAESVKRQQGMLPGKSAMNPRVKHCNATELRCEKPEEKEPEQLSAETASGAEERTEQPASSEVTAPDEPIEIPPVRVYVPKVPYPIPPKHLMDPIACLTPSPSTLNSACDEKLTLLLNECREFCLDSVAFFRFEM
ncbi:hypothetical protein Bca4012_073545 [Brassica carinata]